VAGLAAPHWLFYGFLPVKAGARRQVLAGLRDLPVALVFYEAPHRLAATLADLAAELDGARELLIARELTKRFESLHRCRLDAVLDWLSADANHGRGEFVLVVDPPEVAPSADWSAARQLLQHLLAELSPSQAARLAARITGLKKQALYDAALAMRDKQTSDE
jgi:16S rRNA (cytidine1402-2'-O)-methyltransferase